MERGTITVICGPMFCGKSSELIRRFKRVQVAKLNYQVFKASIDTRYAATDVVSHDKHVLQCHPVNKANEILMHLDDRTKVVGIDEVQFMDEEIVSICEQMADKGIQVIVAGLDMDFKRKPFGSMPALLAIADDVIKLNAICSKCNGPAIYSGRIINDDSQIVVGGSESYEPRCRACYDAR